MSGTYWSDVETPSAPSSIAFATSAHIFASSAGVARRSSDPMTRSRSPPRPTNVARLIVGGVFAKLSKYAVSVAKPYGSP